MQTLKLASLLFVACCSPALAVDPLLELDSQYRIELRIDGKPVQSLQDFGALIKAAPTAEARNALIDAAVHPRLALGQSFQAQVRVKDPEGVERELTGSPLLAYAYVGGCIHASPSGVVTGVECSNSLGLAELWIMYRPTLESNPIWVTNFMFDVARGEKGTSGNVDRQVK